MRSDEKTDGPHHAEVTPGGARASRAECALSQGSGMFVANVRLCGAGAGDGGGATPAERQREMIDGAWRQVQAYRVGGGSRPFPSGSGHENDRSSGSRGGAYEPLLGQLTEYEILHEIQRGGQGVVYRAIRRSTGRLVAIKVLRAMPNTASADRARFQREIAILLRLRHPNIVAIHDSGAAAGHHYYVMDYIEGRPLDEHVRTAGCTLEETLRLMAEVCDAVHVAHQHGVIHRDLKPSNIRIDADGRPFVLDFGLAKLEAVADDTRVTTATGQFIGSLPWAAPEQVEGREALVDARTDVYALGVMLFQVLAGRLPYDARGNIREVVDRILHAVPARPSTVTRASGKASGRRGGRDLPSLPPWRLDEALDTIVLRCLAKQRERRYPSADELGRDLRRYLQHDRIEAKRDSGWYVFRTGVYRHRFGVGVAVIIGLLLLAFGLTTLVQSAQVARQRDRAVAEASKASHVQAFLESMFASVAPQHTRPEEFTVRQVLDNGAERVEQELAGMPGVAADVHETLGTTYNALGLHREAEFHLRRAVELRVALFGEEHELVATAMMHLATALHDKQDLKDAEAIAAQALSMRRRLLVAGDPRVAESANQLASVLVQLNRFAQAEPLAREALATSERAFGEDSIQAAAGMITLGACLRDTGQFDEAEAELRGALEIIRQHRGRAATAGVLQHLAELSQLQRRLAESEEILREVIAIRRDHLGPDHPALAWNVFSLCGLLLETGGDAIEAEFLCREALSIQRLHLQPQHPEFVQYLDRLADALVYNGLDAEAEPLREESHAIRAAAGLPDDSDVR